MVPFTEGQVFPSLPLTAAQYFHQHFTLQNHWHRAFLHIKLVKNKAAVKYHCYGWGRKQILFICILSSKKGRGKKKKKPQLLKPVSELPHRNVKWHNPEVKGITLINIHLMPMKEGLGSMLTLSKAFFPSPVLINSRLISPLS